MTASTMGDQRTEVPFDYPIVVAGDFEAVLDARAATRRTVSLDEFAELALRKACILLQARGGAGKSHTATRVQHAVEARGYWSAVVPAVALHRGDEIELWTASDWLRRTGNASAAGLADQGVRGLVVIDGLNEVARDFGDRMLATIGPMTAAHPNVTFLVTDRLVRRQGMSRHWAHATLGPVPPASIRRVADSEPTPALEIPYYLDRHAAGSSAHEILGESIGRFVSGDGAAALARAAYMSYETARRRTLDRGLFEAAVGRDCAEAMLDARMVVPLDGAQASAEHLQFEHHLLQDYLVGRHLAADSSLWNGAGFDIATLKASSFDSLGLAIAHLDDDSSVEEFVQRIYDWNFYAAAYAILENGPSKARVSRAFEIALLASLAEKRFDHVVPTVTRVEDALRIQQTELATTLLHAQDRSAVVDLLRGIQLHAAPDWYADWLGRFTRKDSEIAFESDALAIASGEPMIGWGAANTLRRLRLPRAVAEIVRRYLVNGSETVRWRAAHTLGLHPTTENRAALEKLMRAEPDSWATYGALRAWFEQISRIPSNRRTEPIDAMTRLLKSLTASGHLRTEALRSMDLDPLPENWHQDIEPLLFTLWDSSAASDADDIAALAARLRSRKENAGGH